MMKRMSWAAAMGLMVVSVGCSHHTSVEGESLVLAGTHPGNLLYRQVDPASLRVRSAAATYQINTDYTVDPAAGTLARTPNSRIPDYSTNMLYGKHDFDHSHFPGFGNLAFTVYVDYQTSDPTAGEPLAPKVNYADRLSKTARKLREGRPVKVIAFGDSITAGGDASSVALQYPSRYAAYLQSRFPASKVAFENGATGGDTTVQGLQRLEQKVLSRSPDLVLVAFGMNDHNIGSVPVAQFEANLKNIVGQIQEKTGAEVILLSTFPPNPEWHYGSHHMADYAAATHRAADATHSAYADIYSVWEKILARKDPPSVLANNINHPNDYGHGLYLLTLEAIEF